MLLRETGTVSECSVRNLCEKVVCNDRHETCINNVTHPVGTLLSSLPQITNTSSIHLTSYRLIHVVYTAYLDLPFWRS